VLSFRRAPYCLVEPDQLPRKRKRQSAPPPVQNAVPQAGTSHPARTQHFLDVHQEARRNGEELLPWRLVPIRLPYRIPTAYRYFLPTTKDAGTQTEHQGKDQGSQTSSIRHEELPPVLVVPPLVSPPTTPPRKPRTPGHRRIRPVSSTCIKALLAKPAF